MATGVHTEFMLRPGLVVPLMTALQSTLPQPDRAGRDPVRHSSGTEWLQLSMSEIVTEGLPASPADLLLTAAAASTAAPGEQTDAVDKLHKALAWQTLARICLACE